VTVGSPRASILRIGAVLAPIGLLCIPKVFQAVINAITDTANWVSFQILWDWHRISPLYSPERDLLQYSMPVTPWSVWLVLAVLGADVAILAALPWTLRRARGAWRETLRIVLALNVAAVLFLLLTLSLRIGLVHLS
jgi:hypothetical protein